MFHIENKDEEDDTDPEDSDPDSDSNSDFDLDNQFREDFIYNSNTNASTIEDFIKLKSKSKHNPTLTTSSNKLHLTNTCYSQLKRMCNSPACSAHYGTQVLLTALMRAGLNRMPLDKLEDIPRDKLPRKYHEILDEVLRKKTFEMMNELGIPGPHAR